MRGSPAGSRWSVTMVLLVANLVCYLLQEINRVYVHWPVERYLFLSLRGLGEGQVYQLLTFQFLHGSILHLLFNCFGLWMFGRALEQMLGARAMLQLYLLSGVLGGLLQVLLALSFPRLFGGSVVGASAGIFGLIAAFCFLNPEQMITTLIYFIPVTVKAKYLLLFEVAFTLFCIFFPSPESAYAHGAHLGGIFGGVAYIHFIVRGRWSFFNWRRFPRPAPRRELVKARSADTDHWQKPKKTVVIDLPPEEFISQEVDPILDKISAHGIHSLTTRERQILEAARARMGKR